jgi:TPR repeat protein
VFRLFNEVGLQVKRNTGGSQQPWVSNSPIDGDFYFAGRATGSAPTAAAGLAAPAGDAELLFWQSVMGSTNPADFNAYLEQYPTGRFATLARVRMQSSAPQSSAPAQVAAIAIKPPEPDPDDPYQRGIAALKVRNYADAMRIFRPMADAGDARAQASVGKLYIDGRGVTQNFAEALKWFRMSAAQNDVRGFANLGYAYRNGRGVPQDHVQANQWYKKAADQGYAGGQVGLAVAYFLGHGVPRDLGEATAWARKAAEQAEPGGESMLGVLIEASNPAEALRWYQKAAAQDDAYSSYRIGLLYKKGIGVTQDPKEAQKWFQKAVADGFEPAKYELK